MSGILPVFPIMFDLGKIAELVKSGKNNLPSRQEINSNLNALGQGKYGGLVDPAPLLFLMEHFGPRSQSPCVFQPLGEMHIPAGQNDPARLKAYWAFTPASQSVKDPSPQKTIVFEAEMSPKNQLVLKKCMMGSADLGFILAFHYECCAVDNGKSLPFSTYTVAPLNGIYTLQHSVTILTTQQELAQNTFSAGKDAVSLIRNGDPAFDKLVKSISSEGNSQKPGLFGKVFGLFR